MNDDVADKRTAAKAVDSDPHTDPWNTASSCRSSSMGSCPGAEAFPTAAKVTAEPKISPQKRLALPISPMDMVITGLSHPSRICAVTVSSLARSP